MTPPCRAFVHDAQFMAPSADTRHWPRMRQTELGAALQLPQQMRRPRCERLARTVVFFTSPRSHTNGLSIAAT